MKMIQKYILCVTLAFVLVSIYYTLCHKVNKHPKKVVLQTIYWQKAIDNITCHESVINDALQSVEDESFNPKPKSIFFHETSCRGGVDSRQACAVESAARANPDWEVYLLFNAPVSKGMLKRSCLVKLLQYPNVKMARIHAASFSKDTVVHGIVTKELRNSQHSIEHSTDIMKMLTLNKWGGMYLDLDVLVVKSFNSLPQNWIAKETVEELSSGIMAFSKDGVGHSVTGDVLIEISQTYDPKSWSGNGPLAIERVLSRNCYNIVKAYGYCNGVSIFSHELFYPIHYSSTFLFFKNQPLNISYEPYTYHLWNLLTNIYNVPQDSPYAKLAKEYCPRIYNMYLNKFGV